jgi:hypothetical protein
VPRISFFHGITIAMFWDERGHQIAHFHAEYGGAVTSVAIDGTVLAGTLPTRQLRLVREWAHLHQDELMTNWDRARRLEPLERIAPLA